jgi:DNA modification methylase
MNDLELMEGDVLERLRELPDNSVQCCVTSPPYWGLRDYGVEGQIGLEPTPEAYVAKMVEVFREVRRVLREDGVCFVNLGDAYGHTGACGGGSPLVNPTDGRKGDRSPRGRSDDRIAQTKTKGTCSGAIKPKDLCGIPWRVAFALQADGWWLRQDIIWAKPNPMPESVTDRCTKAHEYIFLLTKSARYFYDQEAVKVAASPDSYARYARGRSDHHKWADGGPGQQTIATNKPGSRFAPGVNPKCTAPGYGVKQNSSFSAAVKDLVDTRNRRSVWTITTEPYADAHFATFPTEIPKLCILAGTSARGCCPKCGAPWERVVSDTPVHCPAGVDYKDSGSSRGKRSFKGGADHAAWKALHPSTTTGWTPTCTCDCRETIPCTVLDPFAGSGTTGMVALELGRRAVLIELNPKYVELIRRRTNVTKGLPL